MNSKKILSSGAAVFVAVMTLGASAQAATGVQVGASGKTYASSAVQCALHPVLGMGPVVQAGLYNPKRNASAIVSLNATDVATVSFISPDTNVWLANQINNTVRVALDRGPADSYSFDATSAQQNYCIPDTSVNEVSGDLEYAASNKSYATVTPGCAWNGVRAQPYINLFDNGTYLLNGVRLKVRFKFKQLDAVDSSIHPICYWLE